MSIANTKTGEVFLNHDVARFVKVPKVRYERSEAAIKAFVRTVERRGRRGRVMTRL